mmetsp:Transcript_121885/g.344751  ORF Transcript_121885/g.344751 Transcript_121885/m.344751 type:complete len:204 (-) Transcript_121885:1378-1989(-)
MHSRSHLSSRKRLLWSRWASTRSSCSTRPNFRSTSTNLPKNPGSSLARRRALSPSRPHLPRTPCSTQPSCRAFSPSCHRLSSHPKLRRYRRSRRPRLLERRHPRRLCGESCQRQWRFRLRRRRPWWRSCPRRSLGPRCCSDERRRRQRWPPRLRRCPERRHCLPRYFCPRRKGLRGRRLHQYRVRLDHKRLPRPDQLLKCWRS